MAQNHSSGATVCVRGSLSLHLIKILQLLCWCCDLTKYFPYKYVLYFQAIGQSGLNPAFGFASELDVCEVPIAQTCFREMFVTQRQRKSPLHTTTGGKLQSKPGQTSILSPLCVSVCICVGPQRLWLSETRSLILQQIKTQMTTPTSCGHNRY